MVSERLGKLRNIGIIAHIDAGKTTVTERILFHAGLIHRLGNVDEGSTVTDFMPQERERGITIQSAAITCDWHGYHINLIDTPGHIDFTAEVQRSLRVLDGGVVVFDGVSGVEPQSETVWRQANRYGVPRIAFVNKMDRAGADLDRTVASIKQRLGGFPIVIQMPVGRESSLRSVIDLVEMQMLHFDADAGELSVEAIPDDLLSAALVRREAMIESLADQDDEIAMAFLEGEEFDVATIKAALRDATCAGKAVPVLCGSALNNIGVQPLLNAIIDYLPSPLDVAPMVAHGLYDSSEVVCRADANEPLAALMFKISTDPYVGKLSFIRVYSGIIARGAAVYNAFTGKSERIGRLVRMHADRREEVNEIRAGDIGAVLGFKSGKTGHTLYEDSRPVALEPITFPTPVIEVSVHVEGKGDQDKLGEALQRLSDEDPTLYVRTDEQTEETVLAGMGELHLDVVVDRLRREFGVDVQVGAPKVAYCETVTRKVEIEGRLVKQSGGHGQYAVVKLEIEPLAAGTGFEFESKIRQGTVPKEYIPAVEAGVIEAMKAGPLAKQPVVDLKVSLVDGKYHEVDSSERAFYGAAMQGLRDGILKGSPVLLEPMMKVEVVAPQDYTGDVIGELSSRAANISGIEPRLTGVQSISADVPLARMFGFATSLRSATQGRGSFTMEFSHYQRVSAETAKEVIANVA